MRKNSIILLMLACFGCQVEMYRVFYKDPMSCADQKRNFPNSQDGYFLMDLDQDPSTPLQEAYCDFTSGWTRVITKDSLLSELEQYGDVSAIQSTFYTDVDKGIGWGGLGVSGTDNPMPFEMPCLKLSRVKGIKELKVTVTWDGIGNPGTGNYFYGYMYIDNVVDPSRYSTRAEYKSIFYEEGFLDSINAWGRWAGVQGRNQVTLIRAAPTPDVVVQNYNGNSTGKSATAEGPYVSNGNLQICMGNETRLHYDRRFLTELWFK
jgi:hypothetical protein